MPHRDESFAAMQAVIREGDNSQNQSVTGTEFIQCLEKRRRAMIAALREYKQLPVCSVSQFEDTSVYSQLTTAKW